MRRSSIRRRVVWVVVALLALLVAGGAAVWWTWRPASEAEASSLATRLAIQPGMTVGEIGAGTGTMALAMARHVGPAGRVYANELSEARLTDLREAAARERLDQITVVEGAVDRANLPEACCDVVFMRHVYHHFAEDAVEPMLASLYAAIRPGGTLAIIDFPPSRLLGLLGGDAEHSSPDRRGHGVTPDLLVREVTASGFNHVETIDTWVGASFLAVFSRR